MIIAGEDLSISSSGVVVETLDDNTLDIVDVKCYGFTQKKKLERDNIVLYSLKDFSNDYERYVFMKNNILDWTKDASYVAVEDYAYGKSSSLGMVFSLAEFEGHIKMSQYERGQKIRFYTPASNKKFFSLYGLSDKISMYRTFLKYKEVKPDISDLPIVENGHGVAPTSDIIDAFALCEFLRFELKLRQGIIKLDDLCDERRECFTSTKKTTCPLDIPFTCK